MQDAVASPELAQDAPPDPHPSRKEQLRSAIEHAAHYLPSQGPISIFVHHNTLHSFEDLPFEEAVVEGGKLYGCEPYLSEGRYRSELNRGRISVDDLRQVLMDQLDDEADELVASFGTRYTLRLAMLQMTLHSVPDAELRWLLAETDMLRHFRDDISAPRREQMIQRTRAWVMRDREPTAGRLRPVETAATAMEHDADSLRGSAAGQLPPIVQSQIAASHDGKIQSWSDAQWEAFALKLLWRICRAGVSAANLPSSRAPESFRVRDQLLAATGEDTDALVNDVLIRFCGGFLDQGFATWSLPHRDEGFARAFAKLYLHRMTVQPRWMEGMRDELQAILDGPFDPLASIATSLDTLGVHAADIDRKVCLTLLALKGWAGMIWQMETSAPWLPKPIPSGSLDEYLAIRLLLECHAIAEVGRRQFGTRDVQQIQQLAEASSPPPQGASIEQRTYTVFQLAQVSGWTPQQLIDMAESQWRCLVQEIEAFSSLERRRILHAAYERHYQVAALNAISVHTRRRRRGALHHGNRRGENRPAFIAIFCIDDREESFRRHLEEVDPACETASAAGFYAVAMYYQGADHAHYRPLCPAILTPQHYVREEPMFSAVDVGQRRAKRRRRIGRLTHQVHASSRTLIGGWVTGVFGAVATFPMVARIMAPGLTSRIRKSVGTFTRPPATELHLERSAAEPGATPESLGYSLEEMAAIVVRILQDIGVVDHFPPILVFFGHGSASLNNPHESAYNCGACSGGRGGPNARAFAMMANDPRVRRLTAQLGLEIPDEVRFVGAYHNTCSDHVEYYDLDLLPRTHRPLFRRIEKSVNETRARDAHERARRFESAPLDLTPRQALEHVEQRGEDLSQARPEYNHATNALTFVGRREWSRGMFVDRRVFLTSYDPRVDDEQVSVLSRILAAAIPVCAGIALEYYFSTVDTEGYGCGSKLPHNVASMLGVMTGAASDLRPGLSQQMVEIHEPLRHLFVIETTPEKMDLVIQGNPAIARLVKGNWVQIALLDPETSTLLRYVKGKYEPFVPDSTELAEVDSSLQWYRGQRGHLDFASIKETPRPECHDELN